MAGHAWNAMQAQGKPVSAAERHTHPGHRRADVPVKLHEDGVALHHETTRQRRRAGIDGCVATVGCPHHIAPLSHDRNLWNHTRHAQAWRP